MFHSDFLPMLEKHLKFCRILKCVPYEFDSKKGRVIKAKRPRHLFMYRIQCILSVLYVTAIFLNICVGPLTTKARFQGFALFLVYLLGSIMNWNYSMDMTLIQVIHTFLDFEKYIMKGEI
ncbi:hypothetical protein Fcan01_17345 [Folsomia candida]|uniref:Uncharacterized protein n=1 Tax=Folsomia candida TaxID=158441 RepID=A0A226DTD4_FOLCA|nr:hypothetical protein Fcan01_17345 [Folsomia candida]